MSNTKKGITVSSNYWAKHLRKWGKKFFWRRQRRAYALELKHDSDRSQ